MPGRRIKDLTALSGAGSANNDDVVIFDTDADTTKRISRSQLAEGMIGDLPFLYFHGVRTTDPTQRFNGDSLVIGDGYLRSSDMIFRYYTSSGWQNYEQISIAAAQAWAEGTLPGGAGTYSSKEWSEVSEAEADRAEVARDDAQGVLDDRLRRDVTTLLADTTLTYTAAQPGTVVANDIIRTRAEGFAYEVAASGATDQHVTTAGGVKLYRLYLPGQEYLRVTQPTSPTGAAGSAGNLNGNYYYRVTYLTAGGETEPGAQSLLVAAASQRVNLTIPISADRRVVARRLWRTVGTGGDNNLVKLVATINDNTTTTYEDNLADAGLGADLRWIDRTAALITNGAEIWQGLGAFSTILGRNAMPAGGYASTVVGSNALAANTTGLRLTAVGHDALNKNTSGANNVAVGVHASNDNTTGGSNVSVGYSAAFKNITGSENVSIGLFAAVEATSGDRNVAVGSQAMQLRTAGSDNVGIGYQAARAGTGTGNIGIGRSAAAGLTGGNFNTVVGHLAAGLSSGSTNTAVGYLSGSALTTGASNVMIGASAGRWVTTQSNSLFIDNAARTDYNDSLLKALVFGVFGATPEVQQFRTNGLHYANVGVAYPSRSIVADYTVVVSDHLINVTGTATVTLTLPNPLNSPGKILHIKNKAAFTVVSIAGNVQPIAGGASGTAILPATAGTWAILQAVGSAWEITAAG